jgi:hypothetical protein
MFMVNVFNNVNFLSEYFNSFKDIIEDSYEIYVSYVEMILGFWGKNRQIFDKSKNQQVALFNSYMSGYEKAKIDFGIKVKEPSDIYF